MSTTEYQEFLKRKTRRDPATGMDDLAMPELPAALFEHQRDIVAWALKRGRAAVFAQTGLGKSFMELAWGQAVHRATGGNVLLLTPLAVAAQMVDEAGKFGLAAKQCATQAEVEPGVTVTNYAKLHHFDMSQFQGVILDESSILKAFDGKTRTALIERCKDVPYRLAATATPAPNDFTELGNHAEFLGVMSVTGMQATFFVHDAGDTGKWRLKGHAEDDFWAWMCSWSVLLRRPSDLGYTDGDYALPPLQQLEHIVPVDGPAAATLSQRLTARRESIAQRVAKAVEIVYEQEELARVESGEGQGLPGSDEGQAQCPTARAVRAGGAAPGGDTSTGQDLAEGQPGEAQGPTADEVRDDLCGVRSPDGEAVELLRDLRDDGSGGAAALSGGGSLPLDGEGAGSALRVLQPGAGQVHGPAGLASPGGRVPRAISGTWVIWCNLNAESEALAAALPGSVQLRGADSEEKKESIIRAFGAGHIRILITKPSLTGFGLNWQHCHNTIFVGLNDSFEQVYQAIRRFWRYGQARPVTVHFVAASTEGAVLENLRRKEADAERMGAAMVAQMADLSSALVQGSNRQLDTYHPTLPIALPAWLTQEAA